MDNELLPEIDPALTAARDEVVRLLALVVQLETELEAWAKGGERKPRGESAYESRARGDSWEGIAAQLQVSSPLMLAKRWAERTGAAWPVPLPA
jgi:hypothetical protein